MEKQFTARLAAAFAGGAVPGTRQNSVRTPMTPFELAEPATLSEAIALLDPDDPAMRPIAGGTALMLMMKAGVLPAAPAGAACAGSSGASPHRRGADGELRIGAMATLAALEHSPAVARHAPVIARAMHRLSNVRVRNVATVGGNLAHGDPHMDLPPVLIALGATRRGRRPGGERGHPGRGPAHRLLRDRARGTNELIAELRIPAQGGRRGAYLKCTARSADDWPALGVAVSLADRRRAIGEARIVVGAATARPMRLPRPRRRSTAPAERQDARPRRRGRGRRGRDHRRRRGSAPYKRELLRVYARARGRAPPSRESRDDGDARCRRTGRPLGAAPRGAAPRSPAAPNTSTICACPACCTARSSAAPWPHGRIVRIDASAARRSPASIASSPATTSARSSPIPITVRRSTTSRSSPIGKVRLRRRAGRGRAGRRSARRRRGGRSGSSSSTTSCRRSIDEVEAASRRRSCTTC